MTKRLTAKMDLSSCRIQSLCTVEFIASRQSYERLCDAPVDVYKPRY